MSKLVLGIDIGGSGIKGALVDVEKGVFTTERYKVKTPQPSTPASVAAAVKEMAEHFDWKGKIGCGFPALMKNGVAKSAANIDKSWIGTNVSQLFSETTGCEVFVLNDADAAGLAEAKFGLASSKGIVFFLTVGTGIGSAIFLDGKLLPNTELGHLQFKGSSAEHYAADSVRKNLGLSKKEWAKRLNEYLEHVEFLFSPDCFILGGGISKHFEDYSQSFTCQTPIYPAKLLNDAGIIGAAGYASEM